MGCGLRRASYGGTAGGEVGAGLGSPQSAVPPSLVLPRVPPAAPRPRPPGPWLSPVSQPVPRSPAVLEEQGSATPPPPPPFPLGVSQQPQPPVACPGRGGLGGSHCGE